MSGSGHHRKLAGLLADAPGKFSDDDKYNLYEANEDSGLVTSGSSFASRELLCPGEEHENADSGIGDDLRKAREELDSMKIDSGIDVDVSDSSSIFKFKYPDLNDLDSGNVNKAALEEAAEPPVPPQALENPPEPQPLGWEQYYAQDEDGDT